MYIYRIPCSNGKPKVNIPDNILSSSIECIYGSNVIEVISPELDSELVCSENVEVIDYNTGKEIQRLQISDCMMYDQLVGILKDLDNLKNVLKENNISVDFSNIENSLSFFSELYEKEYGVKLDPQHIGFEVNYTFDRKTNFVTFLSPYTYEKNKISEVTCLDFSSDGIYNVWISLVEPIDYILVCIKQLFFNNISCNEIVNSTGYRSWIARFSKKYSLFNAYVRISNFSPEYLNGQWNYLFYVNATVFAVR